MPLPFLLGLLGMAYGGAKFFGAENTRQERSQRKYDDLQASKERLKGLLGQPGGQYQQMPSETFPGESPIPGLQQSGTGLLGQMPEAQGRAAQIYGEMLNQPQLAQQGAQGLLNFLPTYGNQAKVSKAQHISPKSITVDAYGQAFGYNPVTGQYGPLPQTEPFAKGFTVQSTDAAGMPQVEVVVPSLLGKRKGRITVSKKVIRPTESEAKAQASSESSLKLLSQLRGLVEGADSPTIGPGADVLRSIKQWPVIGDIAQLVGAGLSESDAKILSYTKSLSNTLLAAVRGAQVGPKEQTMYEKQLPMPGQPRNLFMQNLALTEKNMKYLNKRRNELRLLPAPKQIATPETPPLPAGFKPLP